MNTKFDYEYIRDKNISGWQNEWKALLDGRFVVDGYNLKEDPNSKLSRLGFTVSEIEEAVGHTGYTSRELEWYQNQPDRFDMVDGKYEERKEWLAAKVAADAADAAEQAAFEKRVLEIVAARDTAGLKKYTIAQANTFINNKLNAATTVATLKEAVRDILLKMVPYVL